MTTPSDLIEDVARKIDPSVFRAWQGTFNAALSDGLSVEEARNVANKSFLHRMEEVRDHARKVAAIIIEACAKVACCNYGGFAIDNPYGDGYQRACVNIADAIRALAAPAKPEGA